MTEVTGLAESSMTLILALFGIGMTLGALAAGPLTDRALRPTLYGGLGALAGLGAAWRPLGLTIDPTSDAVSANATS